MKFQVSSLNTNWVMLWTKFKSDNEQRAITPKVWSFDLWFLCTALLLNEIYLPMKFHVDALHSFKIMLRTRKGRTDGRTNWLTDGRVDYYMPLFGGIKKKLNFLSTFFNSSSISPALISIGPLTAYSIFSSEDSYCPLTTPSETVPLQWHGVSCLEDAYF